MAEDLVSPHSTLVSALLSIILSFGCFLIISRFPLLTGFNWTLGDRFQPCDNKEHGCHFQVPVILPLSSPKYLSISSDLLLELPKQRNPKLGMISSFRC